MSTDDAPAAELVGACVRFGDVEALHDVDLRLPTGAVVAVIGPNGSGKSTLLGLLSGLVRPSVGSVRVLGHAPGHGRGDVAHVLQRVHVTTTLPMTVRDAVRLGTFGRRGALGRLTAEDRERVAVAMRRLDLEDLAARPVSDLSGGQHQRVHVAQALAQGARLLLLDEPLTGLDLPSQATIAQVIDEERAARRTVVLTTHDVGTAAEADLVVLLATDVIAVGPPATALTPEHLARAYGGHVHVLDDGTVVLDDPHHHGRLDDALRRSHAERHAPASDEGP